MPNRLINEKSPYLLQHSTNPVDWYPWGEEAFTAAKNKNLPIFLSVGYSTCYWCHVMERECFENKDIAELMNRNFINIKVDREERPDVDKIYMNALQSITGAGGWPMSLFLTPDLKPFYAATYIPPKSKYGRAGFEDVLNEISRLWNTKQEDILKSGDKVFEILKSNAATEKIVANGILDESVSEKLFEQAKSYYDDEFGGFGGGNKFPRPVLLNYLLCYYYMTEDVQAIDMVNHTLSGMISGGINDQLEGGFHRYSVDSQWRVPHFEKMLYDQAQIITLLLNAYQVTGKKLYIDTAIRTYDYVMKRLKNPDGGFYSAEDAESAPDSANPNIKEEGYYYLFTVSELKGVLNQKELSLIKIYYGIDETGNALNDPNEVFRNKNILYIKDNEFETAKQMNITVDEVRELLESAKEKMLKVRLAKPRPSIDDKILTNLNALMISALAKMYEVTTEKKYLTDAFETADFILDKMYDKKNGILYHRYKDGEVKFKGTLTDYSFMIAGLTDLYEASFDTKYLFAAFDLTEQAIQKFYDDEFGGFFDAEKNSEDLIIKIKEIYDGSEPSGNSVMILNLVRLGYYVEEKFYSENAMRTLEIFYSDISENPFAYPNYVFALLEYLKSPYEIITKGKKDDKFYELVNYIRSVYLPFRILIYADEELTKKFDFIKNIINTSDEPEIFICENYKCNLPVKTKEEISKILKNKFIK